MESTTDDRKIEILLAERMRRGLEARTLAEAEAHFGPWHRRRQWRYRMARAAIGVATVATLAVIMVLPQPDGQYLSNPSLRAEVLAVIDDSLREFGITLLIT